MMLTDHFSRTSVLHEKQSRTREVAEGVIERKADLLHLL
jgi:hypothetical protein